jgi:shikimate dehydrogenase
MVPLTIAAASDLGPLLTMMKDSKFLSGLVSTIPFKADLYNCCQQHGPAASILKRVNTVKISPSGEVVGEMFDGIGFIKALKSKGFVFTNKNCLIIGCGAAGQAIAAELKPCGISGCSIVDTDMSALKRFQKIISENSETYHLETTAPKDISNFDLIINASPLGMNLDDPLPCDLNTLKPGSYVGDCITNFDETNFLKIAKAKGAITVSGADMANGQLSSILGFFGIS